jgi:biopolymer transport protein ExbB
VLAADSLSADSTLMQEIDSVGMAAELEAGEQTGGLRQILKKKFLEGNAGFMSLVALALVLGLAFSIDRIIYLTLSEIDARRFSDDLSTLVGEGKIDEAKELCRNTRGPVASICYQGLLRIDEPLESIEHSIASYGAVQTSLLEKGTSWIRLFISMAPSLGFLGTVIGMVIAFEDIEMAGDLNASIVASGMKVALLTTVFGIIVALILQLFYNYINTKIDRLVAQMEEASITLLDAIGKRKAS